MPETVEPQVPTPSQRRRASVIAVVRGLGTTTVLTAAYFALPLKRLATIPLAAIVVGGVVILAVVTVYQVGSIIRSAHPAARAIEALTVTGPLFLLLFASTYFLMSQADADNFNVSGLTRSDTLYFTVTIFTTVGFGDILATSHSARALVTAQMVLDLILIGAVVRIFIEAIRWARENPATPSADT